MILTVDLVRFWRSKIRVTPWLKYMDGGESIHVDAGVSKSNSNFAGDLSLCVVAAIRL